MRLCDYFECTNELTKVQKRFCSLSCSSKSRNSAIKRTRTVDHTKPCAYCDQLFSPERDRQIYCSQKCSGRASFESKGPWIKLVEYANFKICTKCARSLTLDKFGSAGRKNDPSRLRAYCKECAKEYTNRPDVVQRRKDRYDPVMNRSKSIERNFNIFYSDYLDLLNQQNNSCKICLRSFDNLEIHIDHDHNCCPQKGRSCGECIRGLLCSNCNTSLGLLKDSKENLLRALIYLRGVDRLESTK